MKIGCFRKPLLALLLLAFLAALCLTPIAAEEASLSKEGHYADFIGYQVTRAEDDSFSLRAVIGVNDTAFNRVGIEVLLLSKDAQENTVTKTYSAKEKVIYQELCDSEGNRYRASDLGYRYLAAIVIPQLPASPENDYLEVVIRPFVRGMDGIRAYGVAATLAFTGEIDQSGYPQLRRAETSFKTVYATDDTFIFGGPVHSTTNFGDNAVLQIKNLDETDEYPERAAYFKFHFSPELVDAINAAASIKLRVAVQNIESRPNTTLYDAMLHATDTAWDEHSLTYQNHEELASAYDGLLGYAMVEDDLYMSFDVTRYLFEEALNEDGSLTVSFRITTEGYEDARLVYLHAKETKLALKPHIEIVGTIYDRPFNIEQAKNNGYEPFGYAEALVDEWFGGLRDAVRPLDESGNPMIYDIYDYQTEGYGAAKATGDFSRELIWTQNPWSAGGLTDPSTWSANRFARTLSTLGTSTANAFLSSEYAATTSEYDVYGGITNAGFSGNETGFFHVEVIDGRPYIIDPLGNIYFSVGINDVAFTSGTANQEAFVLEKYGSQANFFTEVSADLKKIGINTAHMSATSSLLAVEDGLSVVVPLGANSAYMSSLGRGYLSGDGIFPYNNTVCLFDPDYVTFTQNSLSSAIRNGGYADNPRVFGYTTDNELPSEIHMLDNYLTLDPHEVPTNAFSYATAWTWLARRMNDPFPTMEKYKSSPEYEEIRREFLGFWYARYYKTTSEAIRAVDPNHMYMGSRANLNALSEEWPVRAAGYYTDMITANLYDGLNPSIDTIINLYRYSGVPFMVTEFFAKGQDALDVNGFMLANSTGAGICVQTQEDRAAYYEHYTLALLESRACVGWTWYRMRDNDQSIYRQTDTGKKIYMAYVSYGLNAGPVNFLDEDGKLISVNQVGDYKMIYSGDGIASNQNVNKGLYNSTLHSVVTVYTYDKNGKLLGAKGYEVEKPASETPADGTTLCSLDGEHTLVIGKASTADGGYTETLLTVYEGKYIAFANSIKSISDHIIGIVQYFDGQ